ncbi:uncharacterized protein Eint_090265 [Encephalitozoon intestinalis ATCC 50506]|uniref:Uncharacterized protein n=1 Tax=Encephalitozoon intestinalis (strain ATCC 50506) TaxID=876142 RepID=W8PGT9_ENCIT|nr:uncharacterized protein Eint_090265 [Encephalitozoon intestinalis ATCC 50506]AHL30146.1 hypothetical protein Eint_090265 [Encephalitozoon intestinalis ATCC 50506]UTX45958.1 hypothetical protein GPK93_09g15430 [Encephalitozoon intestinalis]
MDKESLEKFEAQISVLSSKEIEKVMKRLSKDEFDVFIEILERHNMDLDRDLEHGKNELLQRLENHRILFEDAWNAIPDGVRKHLTGYYQSMNDIL